MKILHVIHRYPPAIGGSETWCAGLARWQAGRGHDVQVVTHRVVAEDDLWSADAPPSSAAVGPDDIDDGVRVRRCRVEHPRPAVRTLLGRRGLGAWTGALSSELAGTLLRRARTVDIVHAHTIPLVHAHAAWVAARLARRPFVLTPHFHAGDPGHEHPTTLGLLRHADRVVVMTPSEATALLARGVHPARIVHATNAFAPPTDVPEARARMRAGLHLPSDVPVVTCLGRKAESKGLDVLLAALGSIRHRPAPALVIAGPGTQWYAERARPDGAVRVVDLPALSEPAKAALLAASDLLVLPSRHEAFGIVFLEAWAAGVAVVGADIPSVRDAVGDAGSFFHPDDPVDLAARIDDALADPEARALQVGRGRARLAARHTWTHVGSVVEAAYADLMSGRRGPAAVAPDAET